MKVQNFYENLSTLHVGTMDNRCWYVPKQDGRESQILLSPGTTGNLPGIPVWKKYRSISGKRISKKRALSTWKCPPAGR